MTIVRRMVRLWFAICSPGICATYPITHPSQPTYTIGPFPITCWVTALRSLLTLQRGCAMATIRKREHHDGTVACQAVIRIKRQGRIVFRESKMFWRHRAALSWARRQEVTLEDPSMLARAQAEKSRSQSSFGGTSINSTRSHGGGAPSRVHWNFWSVTRSAERMCIDCQYPGSCSTCDHEEPSASGPQGVITGASTRACHRQNVGRARRRGRERLGVAQPIPRGSGQGTRDTRGSGTLGKAPEGPGWLSAVGLKLTTPRKGLRCEPAALGPARWCLSKGAMKTRSRG
jgi:hypothetical protein